MIIENTNISLGFGTNTGETFLETYDIGFYSGYPLPKVFCSISGIKSFKRIKSAHLYLKLFNSTLNNNESVGLGYYVDTDEEIVDTIDNGFLCFDITRLIKEHPSNLEFIIAFHTNDSSHSIKFFYAPSYLVVEYEEPYDYLDKQQLVPFDVGKSFNIKQDVLTLNQYISKPLFNDNLLFNYRLVYDYVDSSTSFLYFFPQGWKLNLLETISQTTDGYMLNDENCNKRLFKPTNDSSIYVDSTGTGLLLELQSGGTYRIFNPISSFYKEFDSSGRIVSCHTTSNDSFSVTYSSITITITDSRGNVVTIDKTNDVFTITSNTIAQTYTLNINNSNQLQSISFISCLQSGTIVSDSFEYTQSRLTKITSFDDYNVEFNLETYKLTTTQKYKTTTMKTWFLEYNETYVTLKDVTNNIESRYYLDENKNIIISGENTNVLNTNDLIKYINSTFSFISTFEQTNTSQQLSFSSVGNPESFNYILEKEEFDDVSTFSTNQVDVRPNSKYLLIAKAEIHDTYPVRENGLRGLTAEPTNNIGGPSLYFSKSGEQYAIGIVYTLTSTHLSIVFSVPDNIGTFEISNVFLIEITRSANFLTFLTGDFTPSNISSAMELNIKTIKINVYSGCYKQMSMEDVKATTLSKIKEGFLKYIFSNNLKDVYVYSTPTNPYIWYNSSAASIGFNSITFLFGKILAINSNGNLNFEGYSIISNSNSYSFLFVLRKSEQSYFASSQIDYDGNLLSKTDYRGVITTNTYDSNMSLTNSELSYNNGALSISKSFSYDSYKRLASVSSLVGSQTSTKTIVYASTLDLPTSITDGEGNQAYYEYSPRYEHVKRFYKTYHTEGLFQSILAFSSIKTEKDKKLRTTKLTNQCGDYLFTYDDNKNKLKKIQYQKNLTFAPIFLSNPEINEPNVHEHIDPIIQTHTETLFEISPWSCEDNSADLKFPNNYQYCCVYDSRGRFQYVDDWTVTDFHYYITYNSPENGGTISSIYDASGNEVETTTFEYTRGKVSKSTISGFETVVREYSYDDFDRMLNRFEYFTYCSFAQNYYLSSQFLYDDIDNQMISAMLSFGTYISSVFGEHLVNPIYENIIETKTLDVFGRPSSLKTSFNNTNVGFNTVSYHTVNNQTSFEISRVDYCDNTYTEYDYDKVGNIISITGTKQENIEYEYDELYRLIKETNTTQGYYIEYSYDSSHNITSAVKKTISNNTVISSDSYTYNQGDMTNRLATFNNVNITYDTNSNITSLDGATLTYYRGNKMSYYSKNGVNGQYKYNGRGLRVFKRNSSIIHRYIYDGDKLVREIIYDSAGVQDFHQFVYLYGISGLIGFTYDTTLYLYEKDILNNIIGIYRYTSGTGLTFVNKYQYDAYGNTTVLTSNGTIDTDSTSIGNLNPFRYKSYYFDTESGYYYCQARYYAPFLRRWLSLDNVAYIDSSSIFGLNLYCYCNDNPVMYRDEKGKFAISLTTLGLIIGAVLGATAGGLISYSIAKSNGETGQDLFLHTMRGIVVGGIAGAAIGAGIGALVTHFTGIIGLSVSHFYGVLPIKSITVLGSYPLYTNIAKMIGAGAFDVGSKYEKLGNFAWSANQTYIFDANQLGSNFVIFTERVVCETSGLWKELQLLGEYNIPWEMF